MRLDAITDVKETVCEDACKGLALVQAGGRGRGRDTAGGCPQGCGFASVAPEPPNDRFLEFGAPLASLSRGALMLVLAWLRPGPGKRSLGLRPGASRCEQPLALLE